MNDIDFEENSNVPIANADQLNNESLNNSLKQVAQNPAMLNAFTTVYKNTMETIRFCEQQKTTRTEIRAKSKERIAVINQQRDFLLSYLEKTFDERKFQFSEYFKLLDKAMAKNDVQQMAMCLNGISSLATSSPFKPLLEAQKELKEIESGKKTFDF